MHELLKHALTTLFLLAMASAGCRQTGFESPKPPAFKTAEERHQWVETELLPSMEESSWTYANVPREDGKLLRSLVEQTNRRAALEVGSANGYSAIWIGLGLEKTGGCLVTIEIDKRKASLCREHVKKAGLETVVECVTGDALEVMPKLNGQFDFLFVDPGPMDVLPFVKAAESRLAEAHIIALHNLGFAQSYRNILNYAKSKHWTIKEVSPKNGYGFFLISPRSIEF